MKHIGIDNYPTYYCDGCTGCSNPGGIYLHHAITRPAKKDAKTFRKKNKEFKLLTKYIFPGGELDHIGNTVMMLEQYGFEVHDVENWREHYQRTCRLWHDRSAGQLRCGGGRGGGGQDPALAGLSGRLFDCV
jgi:cyclopropane-fatty-acyl-phospholipid synthase